MRKYTKCTKYITAQSNTHICCAYACIYLYMYIHYLGAPSASTTLSRAFTVFTTCGPKSDTFQKIETKKKKKKTMQAASVVH